MREICITVLGMPAPQGSKRHVGNGVMVESCKQLKPWRDSVAFAAHEARKAHGVISGGVVASMTFTVHKPMSAPRRRQTWPDKKPDVSKLARSTEDALVTGGIIEDDARIVGYDRLYKVFPGEGEDALDVPGVVIRLRPVEEVAR